MKQNFRQVILRVELKQRKLNSEICWFKLCSSKLTITSLTRSDLSVISKRTLSCSFPRSFGFQNGVEEIERTRCNMPGNLNPQVTRNCDLATSTDYGKFFSSYHWCWKLKKILWSNKHSDCTHNARFTVEKAFGVWKSSLIWF